MSDTELFNSINKNIPPLRRDLEIINIQQNGSSYLYFYDASGYSNSEITLQPQAETLLSLIDGSRSINDLTPYLEKGVTKQHLLAFIRFLDENRLLDSDFFKEYAHQLERGYEQSTLHHSVTAGSSYPADPNELKQLLDKAFNDHASQTTVPLVSPKALYAPHIDPRIGLKSYVRAFSAIRDLKPARVVILATSHYAGLYPKIYQNKPFILVNKDFDMPLGIVKTDQAAIEHLLPQTENAGISVQDRAHRMEHSIELHLLFLSYLWQHHFEVVPFLVNSLDELYYTPNGHLSKQLNRFSQLLTQQFSNDETFFLISGDLAHFGKKFGDSVAAGDLFNKVNAFDKQFMKRAANNQPAQILDLMKRNMDAYRICGFPPLYAFLQSRPDLQGKILSYDLWNESERQSAVTYGSILYSIKN